MPSNERRELRARLRATILPGLEQLADPSRQPAELIALADAASRRLRAELESPQSLAALPTSDDAERRAREEECDRARGHLHDTALQILEFIAGDGFGTGLSAEQISNLAGGAARDLRRWIDAAELGPPGQLVPQLERVTADARSLHPSVRLEVGELGVPPSAEQVTALVGAAREAITNARKHARASQVVVRVERAGEGQTAVTVTDDGVGFDPDRALAGRGLGVPHSILGRMRGVGGHASLALAPGGGTRVTLLTSTHEEVLA